VVKATTILSIYKETFLRKETSLYYFMHAMLPYRITSSSGVMFDALAHGIPFIASDLAFFKEFAEQGLGLL
jgi:hypothetical protein